ncbi:glycosyltransferase family 2 protein [Parapedobacter pyrenivorans]|uniref:glycosyltransferase family 2 protein n=1 Tax=Parapedobacter pyrenivorans TaxID=1305674 RepID=UPI0033415956
MEKKISVIIPVYNVEKYLLPALNSVRFQTYPLLEIICVLDCPTDHSANIAAEIAMEDKRVKLVVHAQNIGLPRARNSGVEHATGEYIHFMDSDDLISHDFYELLLNAANKADADVCACSVFYERKPKQSIWFANDDVILGQEKIHKSEVLYRGWAWRYLIKKSFWDGHHFSFPDFTPMQDIVVTISMIHYANKLALCPDAVYFYKNRSASILNRNRTEDSPAQTKQWEETVRNVKGMIADLIRMYKIKRPARRIGWLKERISGKFICSNDSLAYGEFDKKISVIVPVYNVENYLLRALNSIRFQSYRNLEIICVLDCPTDGSAEIAARVAAEDARVRLVTHPINRGLPAARNAGVEQATGEYIHFMDSDDWLSPDFYETLIAAAEKAEADVAACSVFYEKKPLKSIWFQKSEILVDTHDKLEKTEVTIRGWAWRYLIRRKFWSRQHLSFPDLVPMEDTPAMIEMIYYANKVALCPSALYYYKNREGSILNKKHDPVREKQNSENRRKARGVIKDFMEVNKVKQPSRWRYYLTKYRP